jgi:hypothetical protein
MAQSALHRRHRQPGDGGDLGQLVLEQVAQQDHAAIELAQPGEQARRVRELQGRVPVPPGRFAFRQRDPLSGPAAARLIHDGQTGHRQHEGTERLRLRQSPHPVQQADEDLLNHVVGVGAGIERARDHPGHHRPEPPARLGGRGRIAGT